MICVYFLFSVDSFVIPINSILLFCSCFGIKNGIDGTKVQDEDVDNNKPVFRRPESLRVVQEHACLV